MNEDDIILWQDVLDLVAAGRANDLTCPFCKGGKVAVTHNGRVTRLECGACRRFVEGQMGEQG